MRAETNIIRLPALLVGGINRANQQDKPMLHPKIPVKVLAELQRQLNLELGAAHGYRALSFWCEDQNLKGFARYFDKQTAEEHRHANKIAGHLIDRRVLPELAALPAPKHSFKSLLDAALHAQAMEQANTQGVHGVYEAALAAKDYPAQVLMHWFISEQVEEEQWCAEMVERIQSATCAGSLSDLDRHIERYLAASLFADGAQGKA
jgi:ferritin